MKNEDLKTIKLAFVNAFLVRISEGNFFDKSPTWQAFWDGGYYPEIIIRNCFLDGIH
jgi:hypothetical protein